MRKPGKRGIMQQVIAPRIVVDASIRSGRPVIEGTRVPVDLVVAKLAGGMSFSELSEEYELTDEDIRAALSYAASVLESEEVRATAEMTCFRSATTMLGFSSLVRSGS